MIANRYLVLAKIETTYGVDPIPTTSANAIITTKPTFEIIEKTLERPYVLPAYGKPPQMKVGEGVKVSFATEFKGSGSSGTAPKIGALIRACNFTETIQAGTSVTYAPNSSQTGESLTLYIYIDGILHKVHGCVGSFKFSGGLNEIAKLEFEFTGLYGGISKITDTTFPSYTLDTVNPIVFRNAQVSFNSANYITKNVTFDIGNAISPRKNVNASTGVERYFVSNRDVKGTIQFEVISLGIENPFSRWEKQTRIDLSFVVGSTTGNKCDISMPRVAIDVPKYGDDENILIWDLSFRALTNNGNDEIQLVFQ